MKTHELKSFNKESTRVTSDVTVLDIGLSGYSFKKIINPAEHVAWEIKVRDFKLDDVIRVHGERSGIIKKVLGEIHTIVIKPCLPWILKIPLISEELRLSYLLWEDNKVIRVTLGKFVLIEYAKKISPSGKEYLGYYNCIYFFRNIPYFMGNFISENCIARCELEPELDIIKVGIMPRLRCEIYRVGPRSVYFGGIIPARLIEKQDTGELMLWSLSESLPSPEKLGILEIVDRINSSERHGEDSIEV